MTSNRKRGVGAVTWLSGLMVVAMCGCASTGWKTMLDAELPAFGHRNWIVIADSAYPKQSAPGIQTVYTGAGQVEVVEAVLDAISAAPHVQAIVNVDAELESVSEEDAPGVDTYRRQLKQVLAGKHVKVMPHEEIISKLDASAELFNILLLKTDMTIPYTSVFLELDCGYWNAEKEARLRAALTETK